MKCYSNLKEWTTDWYDNMDEWQKYYIVWKKSDTKEFILYDSIYIKY